MRSSLIFLASVAVLAGCSPDGAPSEVDAPAAEVNATQPVNPSSPVATPTIQQFVPEFTRTEPSNGMIAYNREGGTVTLTFLVGGNPDGAATAADCMVQIKGQQGQDDVVRGVVVPSVTSTGEITEDDIGRDPVKVDVMIGPEGAQVTDHGAASKLCGLGAQLDGFYRRVSSPE